MISLLVYLTNSKKIIEMKKYALVLLGLIFICSIADNAAYSFSIIKPVNSSEALKYVKGSEFVKLSFKQFASLTGEKENLWNKLSFNVMKMRVKHDLKKNPDLFLSDYSKPKHKMSAGLVILFVIAGILLAVLILIAIIFGGQKR